MAAVSESVRRITTFFLALFLWLHALFFLNFQSALIAQSAQFLRLTTSEVVLFVLLVVLSFASGSGFWKPLLSVLYIYAFPFVLLMYFFRWCFLLLRTLHKWPKKQANPLPQQASTVEEKEVPIAATLPAPAEDRTDLKEQAAEVFQFLLRPFRRFTFLWCILLLLTTHLAIVRLCLIVVLFHLLRDIVRTLKFMLFSEPLLRKIGNALFAGVEPALAGIAIVTADTPPTAELRSAWNQVNIWTKIVNFLKDQYLVSRWAWALGILCFGFLYTYFAILFSVAYYGIARVGGVAFQWPDALITSLFIPFLVTDLPKLPVMRLLGGIQCMLVVAVGISTLVNFIKRRLRSIHNAAVDIGNRLNDQNMRDKFLLLEAKLATTTTSVPPTAEPKE
jgi:hypothetical protein